MGSSGSTANIINIKSKYILQKIFYNLIEKKFLEIIKYNKNIRKRINININNYKEYTENYSPIEIEIKPVNKDYGQFINIKGNEKYYYIYFDNNKEEIKNNNLN